ncbi:MAG: F0F1 ATP synthase subunit A [Bacteroidia bacterium]|nr:F0F1 ATP synthase subunit A [Bacteroidia bacterium]
MANKINIFKQFLVLISVFAFNTIWAYEPIEKEHNAAEFHQTSAEHGESHESQGFDAGKMIIEHVADSYGWHLWGHTSLPLPIIIKSDKGFDCFMSSKFNHGHDAVQGNYTYRIDEKTKSIIVFDELTGTVDQEATAKITDFSITKNVAAMFFSMLLMLWMFIKVAKLATKNRGKAPSGLQSWIEPLVVFVRDDVAKPSIGKSYEKFMPFLLTVFFFIWINNLLGLIPIFPGGANLTGSISVALVLAAFTLVITFVVANKHYWRHVFAMPGVPLPVLIILTPIEILGLFLRPFVLMIRLFANITAGHIIALAFFSLIFIFGEMNAGLGLGVSVLSLVFTIFMGALELLVAFLQAYVFTLLSAIYFGAAVDEGHDVHHHHDHETEVAHH